MMLVVALRTIGDLEMNYLDAFHLALDLAKDCGFELAIRER
jgi:hypothetical protein